MLERVTNRSTAESFLLDDEGAMKCCIECACKNLLAAGDMFACVIIRPLVMSLADYHRFNLPLGKIMPLSVLV